MKRQKKKEVGVLVTRPVTKLQGKVERKGGEGQPSTKYQSDKMEGNAR